MAYKVNLSIDQGTTFLTNLTIPNDSNVPYFSGNNYTGYSQIKEWYSSNTAVDFTVLLNNDTVTLSLAPDLSANMASGNYRYDVIVIDNANNTLRVIEGQVSIKPAVTNQPANVNL